MWQPTHVKVTVKQAKGLITKGKNGTNDAFVVIGIGKEKYRTSVKEKSSSNVEWREECELAIPTQGNKANVQLTVYHQNGLGIDEFLGQVALPLSDFDVYEKPKYRSYRLKGKPEKDKKKGEKERGELEVMVNFTVKSGSFLDISKKDKTKSSLTSLKHIGGSLMSIGGGKDKQGLKNFAKSVSSKMDKITKPKKKKSKESSDSFSNDLMASKQRFGDADPGVISDDEDEDDFRFDDDVKVNTRTSSPMSTMSRGSSLMHEQVLDTDPEVGSYEEPEHDFSFNFEKPPPKPPRIVDETKETISPIEARRKASTEKVTSFSHPKPLVKITPTTPEISETVIEEEPSFDVGEKEESSSKLSLKEELGSVDSDQDAYSFDLGPPIELPERILKKFESPKVENKNTAEFRKEAFDINSQSSIPKDSEMKVEEKVDSVLFDQTPLEGHAKSGTEIAPFAVDLKTYSEGEPLEKYEEDNVKLESSDVQVIDDPDQTPYFISSDQKRSLKKIEFTEKMDDTSSSGTKELVDTANSVRETIDDKDSAISMGQDPDSISSVAISSRPRSSSNASSVVSTTSTNSLPLEAKEARNKFVKPFSYPEPKTLCKSSSDVEVILRKKSANLREGKRVVSATESYSFDDVREPAMVRTNSESDKRGSAIIASATSPLVADEWERKLYGRNVMTGSTENVSISGSRSSLNTSRESSIHDIRKEDSFTRLPEVKALTLERKNGDNDEEGKKQKRKPKTGLKNRLFNKLGAGGSRERLNEDSRIVEGGNDRLPSIPSRPSKLPQEIHDKFSGKSREDLLEVILNLQSSLEKQVKHTNDLEEYIDNLLLRVMEATPHILQAPIKTNSFKYDLEALGYL